MAALPWEPQASAAIAPVVGPAFPVWTGASGVSSTTVGPPASAAALGHGDFVVTWGAASAEPYQSALARVVGQNGELSPVITATTTMSVSDSPVVAFSPVQDKYLVAYVDGTRFEQLGYPAKASLVSRTGTVISSGLAVIDDGLFISNRLATAYNPQEDEFVVALRTGDGIEIQRLRASDGGRVGATALIPNEIGPSLSLPAMAYNQARNQYLVTYNISLNNRDIRGRVLSASLDTVGQEITITTGTLYQTNSVVAAGPDEYLVLWREAPQSDEQL